MKIFSIVLLVIVGVIAWDSARMYLLVRKTVVLMKQAVPFSRTVSNPQMRILVAGDSTAVGTGATDPHDSTAGRLAAMYPEAEVVNIAVNGQKIGELARILSARETDERFDIVLIQIGANDIIRLTSQTDIEEGIRKILVRADSFGGKVIVLHSGNVGESKFFPWYVRPLLSKRSFKMRDLYKRETAAHGFEYVDLIDASSASLLRNDVERYYADDLLHLSGDGYGLWFDEIKKHL